MCSSLYNRSKRPLVMLAWTVIMRFRLVSNSKWDILHSIYFIQRPTAPQACTLHPGIKDRLNRKKSPLCVCWPLPVPIPPTRIVRCCFSVIIFYLVIIWPDVCDYPVYPAFNRLAISTIQFRHYAWVADLTNHDYILIRDAAQ